MQVACLGHETLPDALHGLLDAPACKFALQQAVERFVRRTCAKPDLASRRDPRGARQGHERAGLALPRSILRGATLTKRSAAGAKRSKCNGHRRRMTFARTPHDETSISTGGSRGRSPCARRQPVSAHDLASRRTTARPTTARQGTRELTPLRVVSASFSGRLGPERSNTAMRMREWSLSYLVSDRALQSLPLPTGRTSADRRDHRADAFETPALELSLQHVDSGVFGLFSSDRRLHVLLLLRRR